jgi:hypothetical protein
MTYFEAKRQGINWPCLLCFEVLPPLKVFMRCCKTEINLYGVTGNRYGWVRKNPQDYLKTEAVRDPVLTDVENMLNSMV